MSVQIIKQDVLQNTFKKLWNATFRTECDINYIYGINKVSETELSDFMTSLMNLNYRSYDKKYRIKKANRHIIMPYKFTVGFSDSSAYQLLKHLQCIKYQIEPEYCKPNKAEKQHLLFLDKLIDSVTSSIIGSLPEYNKAKWNDL